MQKGKFGMFLWVYAAIAFVLAILGQTLLCGLLLGFVIAAEKEEWLTRQVIQAFLLCLFSEAVSVVLGLLSPLEGLSFSTGRVFSIIFNVITVIVFVIVFLLSLIGAVNVSRGQDAGIPLAKDFANRAFGLIEQRIYTNMAQPQNPMQNQNFTSNPNPNPNPNPNFNPNPNPNPTQPQNQQ